MTDASISAAAAFYPGLASEHAQPPAAATPVPAKPALAAMYPSASPQAPTAAPPAANPPAAASPPPAEPASSTVQEDVDPLSMIREGQLYAHHVPDLHGAPRFSEPAAQMGDYQLSVPQHLRSENFEQGQAAARTALASMGVGASVAAELTSHLAYAAANPYRGSADDAMQELRAAWGSSTETNLAAVKAALRQYEKADAATVRWIRENAPNDVGLIRRIAAGLNGQRQRAPR